MTASSGRAALVQAARDRDGRAKLARIAPGRAIVMHGERAGGAPGGTAALPPGRRKRDAAAGGDVAPARR